MLLPLVTRCLEIIYVNNVYICIWRMFVFMSVVVTVWGGGGLWECLLCSGRC